MNSLYCLPGFDHDELEDLIVSGFQKKEELFAVSRGGHELFKFKEIFGI
jgi:hypothetical protein